MQVCFIDMEKTFHRINRNDIRILENRGVEIELIKNVRGLYNNTKNIVRVRHESSNTFGTTGLKQECILSSLVFNLILDEAVKEF